MLTLLLNILIAVLILAIIWWVMTLLPIPQQIRGIILAIFAVMVLIYFLSGAAPVRLR